ncbi:hypothetical protein CA51_13590 [Rosistilla oblonga]|uniref:hypothetical protein n=1 Tax=Rosistilla oblonga TaxID=2527990 RepID=UPI00118AAA9B|nr:hypothetical protein [Rosistilla oblonga]QDV11495.1 hypothetical protein CA51_13590 [Rosistilla oblonga]
MLGVQSIEPDSVWAKTNPVWCYNEFIQKEKAKNRGARGLQVRLANWISKAQAEGVRFPHELWREFFCLTPPPVWQPPMERPGVIGLLKGDHGGLDQPTGFATQISAADSSEGWQAYRLPFQSHHIEDALSRLLHAAHVDLDAVVPEARAFTITDSLKQSPQGSSINIAALLAVIDTWNDNGRGKEPDLLRCCCSFVKPKDNLLKSVGSIRIKLDAFIREYGHGSLVVCTTEAASEFQLRKHFEHVWKVDSFADLAHKMLNTDLLKPLLSKHAMSLNAVTEAAKVIERIRRSVGGSEAALEFADRMQNAVSQGGAASLRVSQRSSEVLENVHRHIGNFAEAYRHSRLAVDSLSQLGEHASFQELAEANARLGSAMFDAHRIHEGAEVLSELVDEAEMHPRLLSAESRVMLFNTHARLLAAAGLEGWERLFRKSIYLQELVEPSSIARTRCYLVHACLHNRLPEDAERELRWFDTNAVSDESKPFVSFYRADLYRRDPNFGPAFKQDDLFERIGRNHAFAFYLQATARQPDRSPEDREHRLAWASDILTNERGKQKGQNLLHLYSLFINLAKQDADETSIKAKIDKVFIDSGDNALNEWYSESLAKSSEETEPLFNRVPHF